MQPYDWCDPRCPNPCTCEETIEENMRREAETERGSEKLSQATPGDTAVPGAPRSVSASEPGEAK